MTPSKPQPYSAGLEKALVLPAVPGDRLNALRRLAARLASEIDNNPQAGGRALSVLAVQLRATLAEIEELAPLESDSPADVIAARRAERAARGVPVPIDHSLTRGMSPRARGTRKHG